MSIYLFPFPRKAVFKNEKHILSDSCWIRIDAGFSRELQQAVIEFADQMQEYFPAELQVTAGEPQQGRALLIIRPVDPALRAQEYHLSADKNGIMLSGGDEAAISYGLRTLAQLLPQTGVYVPEFAIEDFPDFPQRGFMLDVSRCKVPTMDSLRRFIDLLAELKFNQFQLYMEHTFAFSAHERVWHDSSPFTAREILELDVYCRSRFIELVPNFNSFGHLERWLKLDEYKHLAECPDGFISQWGPRPGAVLKPNRASLDFLSSLYGEFLPNFSSRYFNIGCDETFELGQGWSKPQCDAQGKERVYLDFLLQITALAEQHGRTVMFWGDIILHRPELIGELPKNIIALNWGYEANHPFAEETAKFAAAGIPFYVCPGTSSWNTINGRTDNCLANLLSAAENGMKNHAEGYLITDWGDGGHHQYPPVSWPGICAGAAYSWCLEVNRHVDIAEAIDMLIASDCAGVIGDYLLKSGDIHLLSGHTMHNCSVIGKGLMLPLADASEWLDNITVESLKKTLRELHHQREHLYGALPEADHGRLILDELLNGAAMAECSLLKLLHLKGEAIDFAYLKDRFRHVIREHERLWLTRNRPGGLHESSDKIRAALNELVQLEKTL